jgi:phosphoglycerate dehydrogenase-like enzyme
MASGRAAPPASACNAHEAYNAYVAAARPEPGPRGVPGGSLSMVPGMAVAGIRAREPRVAVLPAGVRPWAADAVRSGGGVVVDPDDAEALVWTSTGNETGYSAEDLTKTLAAHTAIRWVQLPWAGVEPYAAAGVFDEAHTWTCGKGVYARPVAEHALALALAGLRHLQAYAKERSWTAQAGISLVDAQITIFGGGGITTELVSLLEGFACEITVVRKHPVPMKGVEKVIAWEDRRSALGSSVAVVLALALTPETAGCISERELAAMRADAWLVNVARGQHVVTDDLVQALAAEVIGGAALDVTDPEPLPDGHPLWALSNCLITPHTANTYEMAMPLLTARIAENVRRFAAGEELIGTVDPALGY